MTAQSKQLTLPLLVIAHVLLSVKVARSLKLNAKLLRRQIVSELSRLTFFNELPLRSKPSHLIILAMLRAAEVNR